MLKNSNQVTFKNLLTKRNLLVGSALLLAGSPLFAAETNASPAGESAAARAFVNCPGVPSVPMTADAEQALPLRQVATLSCGEPVSVLNDNEGYTTRIRTSDGREGFVARMYLTHEASHFAGRDDSSTHAAEATPENGVVRWRSGAPGFDHFMTSGHLVESATVNGVTVQVSLEDTGFKFRATVAVINNGAANTFVSSSLVTLDELQPGLRNLAAADVSRLSHSEANHQFLRTEANAHPSPSAVVSQGGTLTNASFHQTPAPDFSANATDYVSVKAYALKSVNLAPGKKTAGIVWFARDPNARELSLRLSVGDYVYDFPFSFESRK